MRLPRDLSGADLAARLAKLGYRVTRQTGGHHPSLRVGTLAAIVSDLTQHHRLDRSEILKVLTP